MNLTNKRIAITGVASGIGKETAKAVKELGGIVVGFDRNETSDFVDEFFTVDLTDRASIDSAINAVDGQFDALCNIAGLPPTAPVEMVMLVNFIGLKYFAEQMIPKLKDQASIVNLASLAGVGWPEAVGQIKEYMAEATFDNVTSVCEQMTIDSDRCYFFSKELLIVWTFLNWNTWKNRGIRINAVSPGPVDTPIMGDFLETLGERAEEDMRIMGRAGRPEDIAKTVAFLCSDYSVWVNGANIATDGGMNAHVMQQIHSL